MYVLRYYLYSGVHILVLVGMHSTRHFTITLSDTDTGLSYGRGQEMEIPITEVAASVPHAKYASVNERR